MPKVKKEFRLTDDEAQPAPTFATDLDMTIAAELAERQVVTSLPDPRLAECEDETLYPDQDIAIPPLPEVLETLLVPPSKEGLLAQAEARLAALFAEAQATPVKRVETGSDMLRRDAINELVQSGWKHSAAVAVGDRAKELLDSEEDYTYQEALLIAQDEYQCRPEGTPIKVTSNTLEVALQRDLDDVPAIAGNDLPADKNEELVQILHNLQRDITRLAKLLGMEGARKTRTRRKQT